LKYCFKNNHLIDNLLIPYFPNFFTVDQARSIINSTSKHISCSDLGLNSAYQFVDSGETGLKLLLLSFNLVERSKIGVPALICESVIRAILDSGFEPFILDIKDNFQVDFDPLKWASFGLSAVILPHLYGSLHPQTELITTWCKNNRVKIIQDTAQSYGLQFKDRAAIEFGNGGIYSFGPGKASTAAGGGIVWGLSHEIKYDKISMLMSIFKEAQAKNFLVERTVGMTEQFKLNTLFTKFKEKGSYFSSYFMHGGLPLTSIQKTAAKVAVEAINNVSEKRKRRWQIFANNLNPSNFRLIEDYSESMKFKYVFYIEQSETECRRFLSYAHSHGIMIRQHTQQIPKSVFSFIRKYGDLEFYQENFYKLFEISTEASIPEDNFLKASKILNRYS